MEVKVSDVKRDKNGVATEVTLIGGGWISDWIADKKKRKVLCMSTSTWAGYQKMSKDLTKDKKKVAFAILFPKTKTKKDRQMKLPI